MINLEFPASLRESKVTEAIPSNRRHCEGAKRPKQSLGILDFCGVLGAAAPKGLGRSPYKKQWDLPH